MSSANAVVLHLLGVQGLPETQRHPLNPSRTRPYAPSVAIRQPLWALHATSILEKTLPADQQQAQQDGDIKSARDHHLAPRSASTAFLDSRLGSLTPNGLSLIQNGRPDRGGSGHWATAVIPLVRDLVMSGYPVMFVESGGMQTYAAGATVTRGCGGHHPLLRIHDDRDLVVYTPPFYASPGLPLRDIACDINGRLYYSCEVPTLRNIEHDLHEHDQAHGPSVVIFDDAELLRPYWQSPGDPHGPARLTLTRAQASGWRASDLLTFAEARPAPTVVVYDATEGAGRDLQDLIAVSVLHAVLTFEPLHPDHVDVVLTKRPSLADPWNPPGRLTVPVMPVPGCEA